MQTQVEVVSEEQMAERMEGQRYLDDVTEAMGTLDREMQAPAPSDQRPGRTRVSR